MTLASHDDCETTYRPSVLSTGHCWIVSGGSASFCFNPPEPFIIDRCVVSGLVRKHDLHVVSVQIGRRRLLDGSLPLDEFCGISLEEAERLVASLLVNRLVHGESVASEDVDRVVAAVTRGGFDLSGQPIFPMVGMTLEIESRECMMVPFSMSVIGKVVGHQCRDVSLPLGVAPVPISALTKIDPPKKTSLDAILAPLNIK